MNYNDWAKEIHENAVKHGWYDKPISQHEYAALFYSEISEAFEEYRNDKPDVYWNCYVTGEMCDPTSEYDCEYYGDESGCNYRKLKPEGIAIELIDLVIRLLDYVGEKGYDIDGTQLRRVGESMPGFVEMINDLHDLVFLFANGGNQQVLVCVIIDIISRYCKSRGLDFESLLRLKHEYNKTRPYRHEGKRC